jgi:polysaccharide deacetylase 2 family uncharacterized protein YibQ
MARANRPKTPSRRNPGKRGDRATRARRERRAIFVLLLVIGALLVVLIVLLPEEAPGPAGEREEESTLPSESEPARREAEPESAGASEESSAGTIPEEEGDLVTEYYPQGEEPEIPVERLGSEEQEYWWLPDPPEPGAVPGRLYLVLDDAGNSMSTLRDFLSLPIPFTVAVLPQRQHSVETALRVGAAGKEVILHQPMEARNGANPGVGSVGSSLSDDEIKELVAVNLDSVPGAVGLNNHMGSSATEDRRVMHSVLSEAKAKGLFFLDSRTTSATVARPVAEELGVPLVERHVFLDNTRTRDDILMALAGALGLAYEQPNVVMIGHITVGLLSEVIREVYPVLLEHGFSFGVLSELAGAST